MKNSVVTSIFTKHSVIERSSLLSGKTDISDLSAVSEINIRSERESGTDASEG